MTLTRLSFLKTNGRGRIRSTRGKRPSCLFSGVGLNIGARSASGRPKSTFSSRSTRAARWSLSFLLFIIQTACFFFNDTHENQTVRRPRERLCQLQSDVAFL